MSTLFLFFFKKSSVLFQRQVFPCLLPGAGEMELPPFRRLLEGLGFGGVVVTEVYRDSFSQVEELANSLSYTKKAFETPIS